MRVGRFAMHLVLGCAASYAAEQTPTAQVPLSGACTDLMHTVVTLLKSGRFLDAEVALAGPTADCHRDVEPLCTGLALHNVASALAISGRLGEAEVFAQRALHVLEKIYPPDDPALLRPLQVLIAARFGQGEIAKAREAFQRMQSILAEDPEDRAAVHYLGAAFLQKAGERREAEAEYLKALAAFRERGLGATADEGAVLCGLGSLSRMNGGMKKPSGYWRTHSQRSTPQREQYRWTSSSCSNFVASSIWGCVNGGRRKQICGLHSRWSIESPSMTRSFSNGC